MWIILAQLCKECNRQAVMVLDHKPTEYDIKLVKRELIFTNCMTMYIKEVDLNAPLEFTNE